MKQTFLAGIIGLCIAGQLTSAQADPATYQSKQATFVEQGQSNEDHCQVRIQPETRTNEDGIKEEILRIQIESTTADLETDLVLFAQSLPLHPGRNLSANPDEAFVTYDPKSHLLYQHRHVVEGNSPWEEEIRMTIGANLKHLHEASIAIFDLQRTPGSSAKDWSRAEQPKTQLLCKF